METVYEQMTERHDAILRHWDRVDPGPETAVTRVPPLDDEALLAAMRRLAQSPAARQEMGQSARHYVAGRCQPAQVAQDYRVFLEEVLRALPF